MLTCRDPRPRSAELQRMKVFCLSDHQEPETKTLMTDVRCPFRSLRSVERHCDETNFMELKSLSRITLRRSLRSVYDLLQIFVFANRVMRHCRDPVIEFAHERAIVNAETLSPHLY
ncbi:hypothetical protein EVAR_93009_1 [Eumeta japonica]|uniref:Uncharacterized protein n=1 Tax=Eumeta variegata TaxID=151549 RepID=A0A4C1TD71_EUMVA|nr:hypothetical protein EVAR_93009_1 [Eumeta japonica]